MRWTGCGASLPRSCWSRVYLTGPQNPDGRPAKDDEAAVANMTVEARARDRPTRNPVWERVSARKEATMESTYRCQVAERIERIKHPL